MSEDRIPEINIEEELEKFVIWFIDLVGLKEIEERDINEVLMMLINRFPSCEVNNLELFEAAIPIPGYKPGIFPSHFKKITRITDICAPNPTSLSMTFDIIFEYQGPIIASSIGELDLFFRSREAQVSPKNEWFIEEVKRIEPEEKIDERVKLLSAFLLMLHVHIIGKFITGIITRILKRENPS